MISCDVLLLLIILWLSIRLNIILSSPEKYLSNFGVFFRIDRRCSGASAKRISKDRRARKEVPFPIYVKKPSYSVLFSLYTLAFLVAGPSLAFALKLLKISQ